ncbi:hypothetical protein GCM10009839_41580 [Catenulispora yoronensis]|uniref:Secreted protein n=1 Tax=Catenulispora yoronensis TaxID=450799 RepID=A0ABN2UH84_9ACTN
MKLGMIARNGRALVVAGAMVAGVTVLPAVEAHASTSALCSTVVWRAIGASSGSWRDPATNNFTYSAALEGTYDHTDHTLFCGLLRTRGTVQHNTGSGAVAHVAITVDGIGHSDPDKAVPAGSTTVVLTTKSYAGSCAKGYLVITSAGGAKDVTVAGPHGESLCG